MTSLDYLCCWVAITNKFRNCFRFRFRSRLRAAETKGFPLVSADSSYPRPYPRPCPSPFRPLPAVVLKFLVLGTRALTERRPFEISNPNLAAFVALGKLCFVSKMSKTQNHQKIGIATIITQNNKHVANKEACFGLTDFVDVCTVGVRCFIFLNAVEAGGFVKPFGCNGPMRRIVQIPFEESYVTILINSQGASLFSVGPRGPILFSIFGFLTLWDPSGSPGEPWGDAGTLGELDVSIFEFNVLTFETFERIFASLLQATTARTPCTTTSSARSLPPLGSAAACLVGRCVRVVCVLVCLCVRSCVCMSLSMSLFPFLLLACRPLSSACVCLLCAFVSLPRYMFMSMSAFACPCLCLPVCRPVGQSVCQSVCQSLRPRPCLCVCVCVCLSALLLFAFLSLSPPS